MGLIIIAPLAILAGWSIFAIYRWLKRGEFGRGWRRAFAILSTAGAVLGVVFVSFVQYRIAGGRWHIEGFPIPLRTLTREDSNQPWTPSEIPPLIKAAAAAANFLSGVALCLAPLAIGMFFKENRGQKDFAGDPRGRP